MSFDEASTAFADPLGKIVDDPRHSVDELRYVLLGHSERERLLAVMFTDRGRHDPLDQCAKGGSSRTESV